MTGDQLRALAARHAATAPAMDEMRRLLADSAFRQAVRDPRPHQDHQDIGALLDLLREVQRQIAHRKQAVRVPAHPCPLCAGIGEHSQTCIAPVLEVLHDR